MEILRKNEGLNLYYEVRGQEESYVTEMLQNNSFQTILPSLLQRKDTGCSLLFQADGLQSFANRFSREQPDWPRVRELLWSIAISIRELQKYMLPPEGLILSIAYIFHKQGESYSFLYTTKPEKSFPDSMKSLFEEIMPLFSCRDREGTVRFYDLYGHFLDEQFTPEMMLHLVEEGRRPSYGERGGEERGFSSGGNSGEAGGPSFGEKSGEGRRSLSREKTGDERKLLSGEKTGEGWISSYGEKNGKTGRPPFEEKSGEGRRLPVEEENERFMPSQVDIYPGMTDVLQQSEGRYSYSLAGNDLGRSKERERKTQKIKENDVRGNKKGFPIWLWIAGACVLLVAGITFLLMGKASLKLIALMGVVYIILVIIQLHTADKDKKEEPATPSPDVGWQDMSPEKSSQGSGPCREWNRMTSLQRRSRDFGDETGIVNGASKRGMEHLPMRLIPAENKGLRPINVDGNGCRIGRTPEGNEYCIPSPGVSRNHARLSLRNGTLLLQDLHSTNGTYVNYQRIADDSSTELHYGDVVSFADEEFYCT